MWALLPLLASGDCRDRLLQPFATSSIWNVAIGSDAVYLPAGIYPPTPPPPPPAPGADACAAARADPAIRRGCAGWQPDWKEADCLAHGCCYDDHPDPDPQGRPWCFQRPRNTTDGPDRFCKLPSPLAVTA